MKTVFTLFLIFISHVVIAEPLQVYINGAHEFSENIGSVNLQTSTSNYSEIELDSSSAKNIDLSSILESTVGLQIQQSGGLGSYSSVSLRAANSEQVLIFLDGILINDSVSGSVDLSLIPVNQIQRIEVFRGSTPIELGAASMGGAINIITREGADDSKQLGTAFTNHGARTFNLHWNKSEDNNHIRFVSEFINNKNNYPIINDNNTQYVTNDDFEDVRNNAEIQQGSFLLTWKHLLKNKDTLLNSLRYFNKNQNLPNFNNSPNVSAYFNTKLLQLNSKSDLSRLLNSQSQLSGEIYFRNKEEIYDDRSSEIGLLANHLLFINQSVGFKGFYKTKVNTETELRIVFDSNKQDSLSKDLSKIQEDVSQGRTTSIVNTGIRNLFHNGKIIFDTTLASEHISDHLDSSYDNSNNLIPAQSRGYSFSDLRLGYLQYFSDNIQLKINLGSYHRVPYLYELYGDRGFFHGNVDLKAESSKNFDISLDYTYDSAVSLLNDANLYLGYFHNKSKDLIIREYDSRGVGTSQNLENATIQGVESKITWPFIKNHQLVINLTLLNPIIESSKAIHDGNIIPGQYVESYLLAYSYSHYSWFYQLEYIAKYGRYYERTNNPDLKAKDQETLNSSLKRFYGNHQLELTVQNIFDHRYEDYKGYPKPGRTFYLGYNYKF